ncbi:MAG TPA: potassium channel family protein [Candidatus Eisenbacteria bacterium]|nr:potassium channel family protein [Candidatus Eisenbacteria bacterium]
MRVGIREANFVFLFAGLLVLLVGVPLAEQIAGRVPMLGPLGFCVLVLVATGTLASSGLWLRLGTGLVAAVCATSAWTLLHPGAIATAAWISMAWAFCLLSTTICLREVLTRSRVTINHLVGAMCGYLLLAVLWAFTYAAVELAFPGSFRAVAPDTSVALDDLMYLSLITLTTTGYGDVLPIERLARALASLEGVVGQLYVAVLVATLVAQYVAPGRAE